MKIIIDFDMIKQHYKSLGEDFDGENLDNFAYISYEFMAEKPYYQLRGKPVTEEQAFQIILYTEKSFQKLNLIKNTSIYSECFCNSLFHDKNGWIQPDGTIGQNGFIKKSFPKLRIILNELIEYLKAFPFLDFVIAITWCDKTAPDDLYENIEAGIWIHDYTIEFLNQQDTVKIYREYDAKYGYNFNSNTINTDYLKKCLLAYRIKNTDNFIKKYFPDVKRGLP